MREDCNLCLGVDCVQENGKRTRSEPPRSPMPEKETIEKCLKQKGIKAQKVQEGDKIVWQRK